MDRKEKKVLLFSPPGGLWLRGEARCEQDLDNATAYTVTAPTTLCYMGAIFREKGIEVKVIDSPVEGVTWNEFEALIGTFKPDMAILNASVLNLHEDLKAIELIKKLSPEAMNCLILPYFNSIPITKIPYSIFQRADMLIVGEMEATAYDLADFILKKRTLGEIRGIISVDHVTETLNKHPSIPNIGDLDSLPFPARDLIRNDLYIRPDINLPMASIVDGRGCPSNCIYCLAPITTGRKVRKRSVESVISEISECVEKYGIRNFLFRSDSFTAKKEWVHEFCREIIKRDIKISWAANSKTISFDAELASIMKKAGCFLVEFGIESGSDKSLRLQKKGITTEMSLQAVKDAKAAGLLTYGTILIGFPWETMRDLGQTAQFVRQLRLDFIEVQIVAPYQGTELYDMMQAEGLLDGDAVGHDMVKNPASKGTLHVSREKLLQYRTRILRSFYLNPSLVFRTLRRITSTQQLRQYWKYGIKLLKKLFS